MRTCGYYTQKFSAEILGTVEIFYCGRLFTLIMEMNHENCENCFNNTKYLAYLNPINEFDNNGEC